jgi:hypothetical protein
MKGRAITVHVHLTSSTALVDVAMSIIYVAR